VLKFVRAHPVNGPSTGPEFLNARADRAANAARRGDTNLTEATECFFFLPRWFYKSDVDSAIIEGPSHTIIRTALAQSAFTASSGLSKHKDAHWLQKAQTLLHPPSPILSPSALRSLWKSEPKSA
jgi:hypothetical protein